MAIAKGCGVEMVNFIFVLVNFCLIYDLIYDYMTSVCS